MFNTLGVNVIYLKRIKFAFLELDNLEIGEYRSLTEQEINILKSL